MKHILNPIAVLMRRLEEAKAPVTQCTWDPEGPGVIRLHLVPPRPGLRRHASLLHINGQHIIPLNHGNAALLRTFMKELSATVKPGEEVSEDLMYGILCRVSKTMKRYYPEVPIEQFVADLGRLESLIKRVAFGQPVPELEGLMMSLAEYAPYMRAPFRMDLAVMPIRVNSKWSCPLGCAICYAAVGEAMQVSDEEQLTTEEWKQVLDVLWQVGVPQVSFTGGEPLARPDIIQLVAHAEQFVTRLNTSAVLLTEELAQALHAASLDVMQVTVYNHDSAVHDQLVGRQGALQQTLRGIRYAMEAGIEVSVNTPLVAENAPGYASTLKFLHEGLGIRYFTVSGMLPAGGAKKKIAAGGGVPQGDLYSYLYEAKMVASELECELDFTSPGVLNDEQLRVLGMNVPVCGAALGNMAIAPNGEVIPCQSWVHHKRSLGNILSTPWKKIWGHKLALRIRSTAVSRNACPLSGEM